MNPSIPGEPGEGNSSAPSNFIRDIVIEDLKTNKFGGRVHTRFPPEPNGYLHLGHAKSICLNFGLADEFGGKTNLRFDDTNPSKEETEYVDSIMENVRWLGFEWDGLFYASDYFGQLYEWALKLSLIHISAADRGSLLSRKRQESPGPQPACGKQRETHSQRDARVQEVSGHVCLRGDL